jgi:regulation of enolase protein 1 (concanavalin A-like superfamily)
MVFLSRPHQIDLPVRQLFAVCLLAAASLSAAEPGKVTLNQIPQPLQWKIAPVSSHVENDVLTITTGKSTDWFIAPTDRSVTANAPVLLFQPAEEFVLSAKVRIEFGKQWDAGTLMVYAGGDSWAKLAFEMSVYGEPTIVSVVTRGVSDDCNSAVITGNTVYLQVAKVGRTLSFYYSTGGQSWRLVRTFTLGETQSLLAGFSVQSPIGEGASAAFSGIKYSPRAIKDIFKGE